MIAKTRLHLHSISAAGWEPEKASFASDLGEVCVDVALSADLMFLQNKFVGIFKKSSLAVMPPLIRAIL